MSFTDSIKTCLSKYVTFSGRARRPEYWWFILFYLIVSVVLGTVDRALFGVDPVTQTSNGFLAPLFGLAMLLPVLAAGWRRMHDSGKPGWYLLLPILASFATFFFAIAGVMGFAGMENAGADPDALMGPAVFLGLTGMIVAGVVQLVLTILLLWWLTRPTDPETNKFGPVPTV